MKIASLILYFFIQAINPLLAQEPQTIRKGQTISGFIASGDTTKYALELKAGQLAWGTLYSMIQILMYWLKMMK